VPTRGTPHDLLKRMSYRLLAAVSVYWFGLSMLLDGLTALYCRTSCSHGPMAEVARPCSA